MSVYSIYLNFFFFYQITKIIIYTINKGMILNTKEGGILMNKNTNFLCL